MNGSRQRGWRLVIHDTLRSTSDYCRARALAGEPEGLAVLARRQTAGRGTNGRVWQSPLGNLHVSVLLRPVEPARTASQWSLLAGVALADALGRWLPQPRALTLKWPNDALLDGRKLAGILTESVTAPDGTLAFLIIGIGVNLAAAPALPDRPTAALADVTTPPVPEVFARALLDHLDRWRDVRARDGFAPVRAAWLARGPGEGAPVLLRLGAMTRSGAFAGLGADGSLLLAAEGRVQAFAAGEVLTPGAGGV